MRNYASFSRIIVISIVKLLYVRLCEFFGRQIFGAITSHYLCRNKTQAIPITSISTFYPEDDCNVLYDGTREKEKQDK